MRETITSEIKASGFMKKKDIATHFSTWLVEDYVNITLVELKKHYQLLQGIRLEQYRANTRLDHNNNTVWDQIYHHDYYDYQDTETVAENKYKNGLHNKYKNRLD